MNLTPKNRLLSLFFFTKTFPMRAHRIAVSTFFFVNGFMFANWASRNPALLDLFEIDKKTFGVYLLTMASGAIIAMPFTGWLTSKTGTYRVVQVAGVLACVLVSMIPIWQIPAMIGLNFFCLGLINGSMDVSMNGQAVYVERMYKRTIMSSFHAVFSIGMALGAGAGVLFSNYEIPLQTHLMIIGGLCLIAVLIASRFLIIDKPDVSEKTEKEPHFRLPTRAILPLAIIAFCGMTGEGSLMDWSAVFMTDAIGQTEAMGAAAFLTFGASMTIGRLFGDRLTDFFGKKKLMIFNSLVAIVGLSISIGFATVWATFLGFFLVGLGLSTIVPIVYSASGNMDGISPSAGIAMATTIGYAGFFVGPPVIGFLGDNYGLRVAFLFTLALFFVMLGLISRLKISDSK